MFNARFTIFYLYLFSHIFNWNSPGLQSQQISEKCFNVFSDCEMRVADYGCAGEENGAEHALDMLNFYSESCYQFYANSSELPKKLDLLGGMEDTVETVYGER